MTNLKILFDALISEANKMSQQPQQDVDGEDLLKKKVPELQHRWDDVYKIVAEYNKKLSSVLPMEGNYHYTLLKFIPWLEDAEKRLRDLKRTPIEPREQEELKKDLDDFCTNIVHNQPIHQDFNTGAKNLLKRCEDEGVTTDVPFVKDEIHHVNERWDKLRANVDDINKHISYLKSSVTTLEKMVIPINECVEQMEVALESEPPMNFDLDGLEFFVNELDAQHEQMVEKEVDVERVVEKGSEISLFIIKEGGDPTPIKKKVDDTSKSFFFTKEMVLMKRNSTQAQLKHLVQFSTMIDELENWANVTTTTVTNMGPVSTSPDGVKKQIVQIDAVQEEITKQKVQVTQAEEIAMWLCDENKDKPQFCANVKNRLTRVKQPLEGLTAMLAQRKTRFQHVLIATQDFQVAFDDFFVEVDKTEKKNSKLKPISVDWKKLRAQDEELHGIENEIDSLKPMFEKLIKAGEQICKESEDSPERVTLEQQLKDVRKRWHGHVTNTKTRRTKIDKLMSPSQKYFEREDDVCDWLDKIEKKVDEINDVPVSSDEVVVLEKKIHDVEASVGAEEWLYKELLKESSDLFRVAKAEEVKQDLPETERRVERIRSRWDSLQQHTVDQKKRVDRYKTSIYRYIQESEPLKKSLEQFEDALDKRPVFGTDTKKASDELQRIQVC